jgi:hypothetical protein
VFDSVSIATEPMREGASYRGVRAKLPAAIGVARVVVTLDFSFGDPGEVEEIHLRVLAREAEAPFRVGIPAKERRSWIQLLSEASYARAMLDPRSSRRLDEASQAARAAEARGEDAAAGEAWRRYRLIRDAARDPDELLAEGIALSRSAIELAAPGRTPR